MKARHLAWLAPIACLFCPAHLLGFLAVPFGLRLAVDEPHTWRQDMLWVVATLVITLVLFALHKRWHRGHDHGCSHHHVHQKNNVAGRDIAGGDIYR